MQVKSMTAEQRVQYIKNWILKYTNAMQKKPSCLVVGVSGGIDSAVVSTIAALTGLNVKALSMPIHQLKFQDDLSKAHIHWLKQKFKNVEGLFLNLDETFDAFSKTLNNFSCSKLNLLNDQGAFLKPKGFLPKIQDLQEMLQINLNNL